LLFLGAKLLHEKVGPREMVAVLIIIGAVATFVTAAPSEPGRVTRGAGLVVALGILAAVAIAPHAVALWKRHPVPLLVLGAGAAAAVIVLGVISESTALQRAAATRVAPPVLVLQIAIPITMAPLVGGEAWGATPLGGAVLGIALAAVVVGVALLGSSPAVSEL